ncbi:ABC transporter permease [Herminiimonas sp. CN]|uniref:MlaE family ABC transporter permease n=1 Tax=Herminiimonas sp. CN TaxID=1349818 RepID=UPI0004733A71|nr:ABC transporter permease [Herminiimonas sp. CN]
MNQVSSFPALRRLGRTVLAWLVSWWQIVLFSVVALALALSPSTYARANRSAIARQIVYATARNLLWFTVLSALISVVLIRIVVVTALSYGLSRFAIEMVVRVLVLELIPLTAALFVALRCTLPGGAELEQMRAQGGLDALQRQGIDPIRREFLPRVLAGVFSVWMLGAVSCLMTLVLAYLTVYGFTPWALAGYTRVVGQVFNPAVTMILALKIFFFSLAVSIIPMASAYYDGLTGTRRNRTHLAAGLAGMVRLFAVVLVIEVASLMGNYY